jgi:hypothetical protein
VFAEDWIALALVVMALGVTLLEVLVPSGASETTPRHGAGADGQARAGERPVPMQLPAMPRLSATTGQSRGVPVGARYGAVPGKHA